MRYDVKKAVGKPDSSVFIRRLIIYGLLLVLMLIAPKFIFPKIMVSMAAGGLKTAWYLVFVPLVLFMMLINLFKCWRRRYPLAYMDNYNKEAKENGYEYCPRCGYELELRKRTRYHREKTGELITTTTYSDGSKTVDKKDVYGNVKRTEYVYKCSNNKCLLEVDRHLSQSHLPWKNREIRCLTLNDDKLLSRKHPNAASILLSRLFAPFLAIIIILACIITIYSYANLHNGEWEYLTVNKEASRTESEYKDYLLSLDTENPNYHFTYEKEASDLMSYLGKWFLRKDKTVGYTMNSYSLDGVTVLNFNFDGYDASTGIPNGWYTLTEIDGVNVILDDTNEKIYKEGTEFYDTFAPKLLALSYDKELQIVLDRINGGEHGLYGTNDFWTEYIRQNNTTVYSYMQSKDATKVDREFRAITTYPDDNIMEKWYFSYSDDKYEPDDLEGYVYSDAVPEISDELGKLINDSSDGSGSYALYKNGTLSIGISVEYLANGYDFEIEEIAEDFSLDLKLDAIYRVNTNAKSLTKITTDENYKEIETELSLAEHQDKYDFFMSIIPDIYIRSIIDMDSAEIKKENAGLTKIYTMKDENGSISAEMKVSFGKIGEVIHYISENEYAIIELGY